ncbi:hypothetical protein NPX13_g5740 [Xylaria arbuscula]|uniref:Fe2OG dioxygenase domain-containing protein n=1 Tax=Xylaria arbuscula TaxID=114810 RepID=A0A9W8ND55_9PEZI|nr:hypothetical protein NPX13_g5740 [Xylaria arbuscula]
MFPIDATLLPSLATRKALLVVDAQNDFLAEDGALPITVPFDLPQKISDLAVEFRRNGGETIWVQSQFDRSRPVEEEQIMLSNASSPPPGASSSRGRRSRATPPAAEPIFSPEAFLTPDIKKGSNCVKAGMPGTEMHPVVKQAVGPKDYVLVKTFYSAFKVEELLRILRVRFVTELFICGSLTNIGVMATAIDAASYGYTITIVDDCCGAQSVSRYRAALGKITSTTGCDTLSAAKVLSMMRPKPPSASSERTDQRQRRQSRGATGDRSPSVRVHRGNRDVIAPPASDIQQSFERLSLSGEPAATDELASTAVASPQERHRQPQRQQQSQPQSWPQLQSQSQSQSPSALQSMAGPNYPQTQTRRDRNPIAAATSNRCSSTANNDNNNFNEPSNVYTSAAAAVESEGHHESVSQDKDDHHVIRRDSLPRSLTPPSPSSSKKRRYRQHQQVTPPFSSSELSPSNNGTSDAKNVARIVDKERSKPKDVEDLSTTINNTISLSSSRDSHESLMATATSINTTRKATTTARHLTSTQNTEHSKTETQIKPNIMQPQTPQSDAQSAPLCEGDTKVIYNILPEALCDDIFERIRAEVEWKRMSHQGGEVPRLVAVQGLVESDGSKPVYRHPADESPPLHPFTPAVDAIRTVVEQKLGHPLNHVLIQLYRAGTDYISEHSDKTLDIAHGSYIANVSLGAERAMTLRTKREPKRAKQGSTKSDEEAGGEIKAESEHIDGDGDSLKRQVQRAQLPHNSLFQMGLATNARWLHGIRQDKRAPRDKGPAELAYEGARISLTFRHIATFLTGDEERIWGQGATAKTRESARPVINGLSTSAIAMLKAFGRENRDSVFNWKEHYGAGFDVLHITAAKRLFLSGDSVVNLRLRSLLAELGVSYATGSLAGGDDRDKASNSAAEVPLRFIDNDEQKTVVSGQRDILLYVDKLYGRKQTLDVEAIVSDRFEQGMKLLDLWRSSETKDMADIVRLLVPWEEYAAGDAFIGGAEPSLADFAFWPVLHDVFSSLPENHGLGTEKGGVSDTFQSRLPHLCAYYDRMKGREAISQLIGR